MKINELVNILEGRVVCGEQFLDREIEYGFASDLMSDVLTLDIDKLVLITGLNNLQTIRTAEMADIECIVFARNKRIHPSMVELAAEHQMVLVECRFSMFKAVARLSAAGLKPVY
ncbi:DRTGG domain-containing protein [Thermophagus xiamenensis]|uniref:DRTGG domain-containing protein n=1 Tax=Thermophagus xiamenensis TaxID=385682 RepID=A0A1I1W7R5_9BACT|nr:DRTGG domain-containing protein [Thermophagus xiamenensis]SFD89050.1 DRTGG domain-containing protein [Thermophagus xiamenensis]